jgi:hypothetical protein
MREINAILTVRTRPVAILPYHATKDQHDAQGTLTGITGQDVILLAEYLLDQGYEVHDDSHDEPRRCWNS